MTFSTESLIRAMAPIDHIIQTFQESYEAVRMKKRGARTSSGGDKQLEIETETEIKTEIKVEETSSSSSSWASEDGQGQFAHIVSAILKNCESTSSCSTYDYNNYTPSDRYIRTLLQRFVAKAERYHGFIENDNLLELMMEHQFKAKQASAPAPRQGRSLVDTNMPDPKESCHVSYRMAHDDNHDHHNNHDNDDDGNSNIIGIKTYPHHNDVGVRKVWEAGGALAEYIMEHPNLVQNKTVLELGAGVGLTGIVIAGCCHTHHVHMTDYTAATLENMEHNVSINQRWVQNQRRRRLSTTSTSSTKTKDNDSDSDDDQEDESNFHHVTLGYLEWDEFAEFMPLIDNVNSNDNIGGACNNRDHDTRTAKTSTRTYSDGIHLPSTQSLNVAKHADVLIAADVIYDRNAIPPLVSVIHNFLTSSSSSSKLAIIASTLRNAETFAIFEREIEAKGIECTFVPKEDVNSMHRIFPVYFVQPRTDIRICLMRAQKSV